jgi:hypothetical protein
MAATVFTILYTLLTFLIIINMYIAVILENYSQAKDDIVEGISDEDYDLFYEAWREFDPEGSQFIAYEQLSEFLDALEPPLRLARPNKYKIVQMDLPIVRFTHPETGEVREDCVFSADVLDVLTQDFFARKNPKVDSPHVEDIKVKFIAVATASALTRLSLQVSSFFDHPGYERVSSSMWKQREAYSASLIMRVFASHHGED